MIAILLLLITSFMKQYVVFMTLTNLNIINIDFVILNIYSAFLIIIVTFTVFASYYMLNSSKSSLKELNFLNKLFNN